MFTRRIPNFHVCLVLIFLLTRILCPPWLYISISACTCGWFLFTQMPRNIKKGVPWYDCMWLTGVFPSLYCHTGDLWCYSAHLLGVGRSDNGSEWKVSRSNELITGVGAFSAEIKALCYYVTYADKKSHYEGFQRGSFNTHLKAQLFVGCD